MKKRGKNMKGLVLQRSKLIAMAKNIIDNLINEEQKTSLKIIADRQFEEILKNLKLEKISEIEQVYLQLEICKRLASHYEKEKARLAEEALKKTSKE
jgi:hypothetical protein